MAAGLPITLLLYADWWENILFPINPKMMKQSHSDWIIFDGCFGYDTLLSMGLPKTHFQSGLVCSHALMGALASLK